MRKNVKQQFALRVLSTAALVAMVSSIATAAFAAEYNVKDGSVDILAEGGKQYITQWKDESKSTYVTDDKGEIKKRQDDDITLTTKNKDTGETETTSNTVTIDAKDGNTANVTLQDVDIESSSKWSSDPAPIEIKGNGNTNLELNGNNTVFSGNEDHAGIEKADVNGTGTLTIKDDVNDDGSEKTGTEADTTGKLVAGGFYNGAAIGGGGTDDTACTSNITITGGKITASGGYYGAGIGAGCYGDASNIRIKGNADVAAFADGSAAIGSGYHARGNSDITITDHATVEAAGLDGCAIGSGHDSSDKVTITISGNASVNAQTRNSPAAIGSDQSSATVNIEDHADVTAVGGYGVAIGTGYGHDANKYHGATSTVINITGGTVNAVTRGRDSKPAIGTVYGNLDLTINSSTGKTTVNAYTTGSDSLPLIGTGHYDSSWKSSISPSEGAEYNEDGSSHLGEDNAAIINFYRNTPLGTDKYKAPKTLDGSAFHPTYEFQGTLHNAKHTLSDKDKGDLYKVVHNRKYMEENPNIDTKKLEDEDLHDWKLVGKVVEPTLEKDGYADYICSIDKCGQTKHVVLPKTVWVTPSTPDTPDTPDTPNKPDVPSTPEVTPADPAVTPDAPAQDGTAPADTLAADTTADTVAVPADAQNVVQDAKPEAAATAAVSAAALPQTGANWLAVVGTALSGLFLLAAGFVLDRKNRRMN